MRKPESVISAMGCEACWIVGQVVDSLVQYNTFTNLVETAAIGICNQELDFWVCRGFVNSLAPVIIQNLETLIATPQYICTEFVSACEQKYFNDLDPAQYVKSMLADKPDLIANDSYVDDLYQQISNDPNKDKRNTLKIVQFTDIHLDLDYVSGTSNQCDMVICCRKVNGYPANKSLQAGPMGSYGCDVPVDVLTTMGEYVN